MDIIDQEQPESHFVIKVFEGTTVECLSYQIFRVVDGYAANVEPHIMGSQGDVMILVNKPSREVYCFNLVHCFV